MEKIDGHFWGVERRSWPMRGLPLSTSAILLFFSLHTTKESNLPVAGALQRLVLNHLNPVVVRVEDKGHGFHAAISQALLPVDIQALETFAGSIEVVDGNT